jgi:bifunctional non-homologous end joining protein LigD
MAARRKPAAPPDAPLEEYRRKRDFERTAEPAGTAPAAGAGGRRFVVQKHAARQLHYDFRLELDGVLKSWAVPRGPSLDPAQKQLAVLVEDHPIEYIDFEGAIPKGEYGGGTVMVWDAGAWEPIGDAAAGFARGDLKFRLLGAKLRGAWVLARMGGKGNESGRNWLLIKKRDGEARSVASFNVLAEMPRSVRSGRTMEEIAADPEAVWTDGGAQPLGGAEGAGDRRGAAVAAPSVPDAGALPGAVRAALPAGLRPQLATAAEQAPEGDAWLHEIKLDGYRMICRIAGGAARLFTRNGHDWTDRMPGVAEAAARLPVAEAILDGEIVVLDARGVSDFQALQNAFRGYRRADFHYDVFDIPFAGGFDLRRAPLRERKAYLEKLLLAAPLAGPVLRYCGHITGKGPVVLDEAARAGLEGIVSKRLESPYESRRTDSWRKVKCIMREEFVVGGATPPAASRRGFGALLLGYHDEAGRLVYCGRVGTGFDEEALRSIATLLERLRRATPPFVNPDADPEPRTALWAEPRLVAEVEYNGLTDDGLLRQASFRGLRLDKDASEVVRAAAPSAAPRRPPRRAAARAVVSVGAAPQDAVVAGVRVTHPARTVYPDDGVSKLDVARYYETVAGWMLPHVAKRPLSLVRCPLGLAGESFYQREVGEGFPEAVRGITVGEGKSQDHAIVVGDVGGLVSLAQMGVLEIHAWGCRADDPGRPDRLIFDLDPGPGILWGDVVESALFVRRFLEGLGLRSFVKTTGGKGLHVVVPVVRKALWPEAKAFTKGVADALVKIAPRNFVATISKAQRDQRIFIDYLRNQPGATAVAAYSTRARNGATVSTPLAWDELTPKLDARALNVRSVPGRLAEMEADPWEGFGELRQSITAAMQRAVQA